jgi:hypothetical protein
MTIKRIDTNDCEIRINAKSKGDFGFVHIGGMERSPKEEYRECEDILSQIKRHVDGVGWTDIAQKQMYETASGDQFDSLYEALEELYDEHGSSPIYSIRYERPSDNGTGTRRTFNDFKEVITEAWSNPWKFELQNFSTPLTEEQEQFLSNVIAASLKEKSPQEVK